MEFENPLWAVEVDRGQISQVIHNIVLNASQAIEDQGKIDIRVSNESIPATNSLSLLPGNYVKIDITDTGAGISEENLTEIFNPYFTTRRILSISGFTI